MSNEVAITENQSIGLTSTAGFELGLRIAKMMASSSLVPKEYQGNIPNCAIALNMAARVGADPLQVMQNLVVIHGRPSWSSQFLIATFNQCGRFSSIRYRFSGDGDDYGCVAWATEKETGETIESSRITIQLAKDEGWYGRNGSKWKTMPQQMLMYRSAAWLVRAYAPELSMGLHTREEIADTLDAMKIGENTYDAAPVMDINERLRQQSQRTAEVVDASTGEIVAQEKPAEAPADPAEDPELADWISAIDGCSTIEELDNLRRDIPFETRPKLAEFLKIQQKAINGRK